MDQPAPLIAKSGQRALDGADVAAAKKTHVDQQRVKVINIAPRLKKAVGQRAQALVMVEKGLAKGAKQGGKGQLYFRMAVINGRIEKAGNPVTLGQDVSGPHVTVQQRRPFRFQQPAVQIVDKTL